MAGHIDKAGTAYGLIVSGDLGSGGSIGAEVEHAGCFVGAGAYDFGAVLEKVDVSRILCMM